MKQLNAWAAAVHAHSLDTGNGITPQEAVARFGAPVSNTPSSILYSAMRTGWFRREHWEQPSKQFGMVNCSRYFALNKEGVEHRPPAPRTSSFHGMKRVRWVFDLGSTK